MEKIKCPHCGKPGISVFRKMCLGPAVPTKCSVCSERVGVSYFSILAIVPFLLAVLGAALVEPPALKVLLWFSGFVVTTFIYTRCVPLQPRT